METFWNTVLGENIKLFYNRCWDGTFYWVGSIKTRERESDKTVKCFSLFVVSVVGFRIRVILSFSLTLSLCLSLEMILFRGGCKTSRRSYLVEINGTSAFLPFVFPSVFHIDQECLHLWVVLYIYIYFLQDVSWITFWIWINCKLLFLSFIDAFSFWLYKKFVTVISSINWRIKVYSPNLN